MFFPRSQAHNQQNTCDCDTQTENVWCLLKQPLQRTNLATRYRSPWAAKVRCDTWLEKTGCCKTIGPPPKMLMNCPCRFLRKHSRQVPVFFSPTELRVSSQIKDRQAKFVYQEPIPVKAPMPPLDTGIGANRSPRKNANGKRGKDDCPIPSTLSKAGLFRGPKELPYEQRHQKYVPRAYECDEMLWENLFRAASEIAAERCRKYGGQENAVRSTSLKNNEPTKDFVRSNALHVVRMPARRLHRCYIDQCGSHLLDMSDSPYVMRPTFGKIPAYLQQRKMELYFEDLERSIQMMENPGNEDPALEGLQKVDEAEKETVIDGLKNYWSNLFQEYNKLLLNISGNERLRETKRSLEQKMKEVEKDIRLLTESGTLFVGDIKESRFL